MGSKHCTETSCLSVKPILTCYRVARTRNADWLGGPMALGGPIDETHTRDFSDDNASRESRDLADDCTVGRTTCSAWSAIMYAQQADDLCVAAHCAIV